MKVFFVTAEYCFDYGVRIFCTAEEKFFLSPAPLEHTEPPEKTLIIVKYKTAIY